MINIGFDRRKYQSTIKIIINLCWGFLMILILNGCSQIVINDYKALAITTYTWRVEYFISRNEKNPRIQKFSSTSITNINGQKPDDAFGGQDDQGLWWPNFPDKPTLDEIENEKKMGEQHSRPELLRTVKYQLQYQYNNENVILPTNYAVYRQAVKANQREKSLKLTLGLMNQSVQKAEALN